jgi:hypothetical protein
MLDLADLRTRLEAQLAAVAEAEAALARVQALCGLPELAEQGEIGGGHEPLYNIRKSFDSRPDNIRSGHGRGDNVASAMTAAVEARTEAIAVSSERVLAGR